MKCQRLATNCANTNKVAWVGLGYIFDLFVNNAFKELEQRPEFGNTLVDQLGY